MFEGLELDLRERPEGRRFCVATGAKMNEERVEDYQEDLDKALAMGLPMICANPDIWVPIGDVLAICAGAFAEYYESKGGDVYWHGKPHRPIYERVFAGLEAMGGSAVDPARTHWPSAMGCIPMWPVQPGQGLPAPCWSAGFTRRT